MLKRDWNKLNTVGEVMDAACECQTPEDGAQFLKEYADSLIALSVAKGKPITITEAQDIVRENIGYMGGYYDPEERVRLQSIFNCPHPIFGMIEPTPEEAFTAGLELGKSAR